MAGLLGSTRRSERPSGTGRRGSRSVLTTAGNSSRFPQAAELSGQGEAIRFHDTQQPSETEAPGSGTSIALGTALDAVPEALVLGVTLRAGGPDLALIVALALSNFPEALSGTAGMRLASRSSTYVLSLWSGIALGTAATTAFAFYLLSDLSPGVTAILMTYGAGALIAMAAETMIPEAFHNGPRYSGVLAALGFAALILLSEIAR